LLGDRTLPGGCARPAREPAGGAAGPEPDRFKLVNESYSHGAGIRCLRMVADRMKSAVRERIP